MRIINILFVINYILAIIYIFYISSDKYWSDIVKTMSIKDKELLNKNNNNNIIRHITSILYLIPGYAIFGTIKIIINKILKIKLCALN